VITSIGFFNGRNFLDKKIQQKLSCCLIQKNWEIIGICHLVQIQVRFAHLVGGGGGSNFLIWQNWTPKNPDCDHFILKKKKEFGGKKKKGTTAHFANGRFRV